MYQGALAVRRTQLGNENIDTANTIYELADLHSRMGDFAAADPLFRETLELRRKLLGKKSSEVAKSLEGLGLNLFDQGDYDAALVMLREAVAL